MAKDDRRYDSDEEMAAQDDERQENGEEAGDDEEYEIEQILEAKYNAFPNSKIGYLVKWKGYGTEDNSWVNEDDAAGAADLIEEYWAKQKKANPRKSVGPRKSLPSKAREPSPEVEAPHPQKRARASLSKAIEISDEEEEEERPKPKKTKTDTASARKSLTSKSASVTKAAPQKTVKSKRPKEPTPEDDEEEDDFVDMRKWKGASTWEHIVDRVDTVERTDDGDLLVYFTLNQMGSSKVEGTKCREDSTLCKEKFPKTLLEFYERNLRWRKIDEPEPED